MASESSIASWWPWRLRDIYTAHRLRVLITFSWCPECNSSPPLPECSTCLGWREYGHDLRDVDRAAWAGRYVATRTKGRGRP